MKRFSEKADDGQERKKRQATDREQIRDNQQQQAGSSQPSPQQLPQLPPMQAFSPSLIDNESPVTMSLCSSFQADEDYAYRCSLSSPRLRPEELTEAEAEEHIQQGHLTHILQERQQRDRLIVNQLLANSEQIQANRQEIINQQQTIEEQLRRYERDAIALRLPQNQLLQQKQLEITMLTPTYN